MIKKVGRTSFERSPLHADFTGKLGKKQSFRDEFQTRATFEMELQVAIDNS